MKLSDLPQVQALSAREKLQLLDELWADVSRELEQLEPSSPERALLDERWADFLQNPDSALTLDEFKRNIRELRG